MSGLPDGWEADYDGTRWFYRYKATGIVQYQFPKEGDEFPEWFDGVGDDIPLEPEAWLASEQQMRRKSTLVSDPDSHGELSPTQPTSNRRKKSETIPEDEHMSATGYFDPSSFMYFGPGGDISPVGDDNDANSIASGKRKGETPTQSAGPTPSTVHSHISPLPGLPAELAQHEFVAELPEHPVQLWKPTGYVAELPTLDTIKCAEELAPIEMDGTSHIPTPIQTSYVDSGPIELPTHRSPVESKGKEPEVPEVAIANPPMPSPPAQQTGPGEYPLVSASFAYPPVQQQASSESMTSKPQSPQESPPPIASRVQAPAASPKPVQPEPGFIKYQPWSPPQGVESQSPGQSKRSSLVLSGVSVLQSQESELGPIRKLSASNDGPDQQSLNHPKIFAPPRDPRARSDSVPTANRHLSSGGQSQHTPPRSPVPASLQPAGARKRVSLPDVPDLSRMNTSQPQRNDLPGASARHESISAGNSSQEIIEEHGDPHAHPRALTPADHGPRHMESSSDLDARQQRQPALGRSATAFTAYNPSQRPAQSSPLAPEGSQSAYQRPPIPAGGWSGRLDKPVSPPGPRRLHTEPNLSGATHTISHDINQHHGPQELSSDSVQVPAAKRVVLTDPQRAHIAQASPPVAVSEMSSNQLPYPINDNIGVPDVRPLSLTRSKSPSPETRNVAAFDTQSRPLRGMSNDILSEVMSVMDESIDSSRRHSGNVSVVSPAPSEATQHRQSEVSLLSQNTGTSISSASAAHPSRERDSLSVPSELDSSHVSPLASPLPSRQQSLSNSTHQPGGHEVDPRRASVPIDGSTSPRFQVSPLPLRQQLASSPRIQQQQVPPVMDLQQSNLSSTPQVTDQGQMGGKNTASPTHGQAGIASLDSTSTLLQASSHPIQQNQTAPSQTASAAGSPLQQNSTGQLSNRSASPANNITNSSTMFVQSGPPQTEASVPEHRPGANNSVYYSQGQSEQDQVLNARYQNPQKADQQQAPELQIQEVATEAGQGVKGSPRQVTTVQQQDQVKQPQYNFTPCDTPPVKVDSSTTGSLPPPEQPNMALPFGLMMLSPRQSQEPQPIFRQSMEMQATESPVTAVSPASSTTLQHQAPKSSSEPNSIAMATSIPPRESSYGSTTAAVPISGHSLRQSPPTQEAIAQASNLHSLGQSQTAPTGNPQSTENVAAMVFQGPTAGGGSPEKSEEPIPHSAERDAQKEPATKVNGDSEKPSKDAQESPKPFPMLPGQVTPLPSQVGSAPVPWPSPPVPMSPTSPRHDSTSSQVSQMTPQNTGPSQLQQTVSNQSSAAPAIVHTAPTLTQSNSPNDFAQQLSQHWQGQGTQQGQMPQNQQVPQQQWQQPLSSGLPQSASNSSITDAGKSMKKWAKKMFSSEKLSSQTQQAMPSLPIPSQVKTMPQQAQNHRPLGFQQVPGHMPQGQMPQVPMYNLPVRAQPPLKSVPEEPYVIAQSNQVANVPIQQAARPQQPPPQKVSPPRPTQNGTFEGQGRGGTQVSMTQGTAPQGQGRGVPLPNTIPPSHAQTQQQRPPQAAGQLPTVPQGQLQPQAYYQQHQKPAASGTAGFNHGQMAMRPMNPSAVGGQVQSQHRPQGQAQPQPIPGGMPTSNSTRPSSGSFTAQPMIQPTQGRGGAIAHQMQINPQGRISTQPPMANPAGPMPQQFPNVVLPNGQVQGYGNSTQGHPSAPGQQGQQGQVYTTQAGSAQAQNMMSFAQRQQAQPQPNQTGPAAPQNMIIPVRGQPAQNQVGQTGPAATTKTVTPQGGAEIQAAAPTAPAAAPAINTVATANADRGSHKKSWSRGKVDYEGGDWGDDW